MTTTQINELKRLLAEAKAHESIGDRDHCATEKALQVAAVNALPDLLAERERLREALADCIMEIRVMRLADRLEPVDSFAVDKARAALAEGGGK